MKYFFLFSIIVFLTSCSTNKAVRFDSSSLAGKTIYFNMTENSQSVLIQKTGTSLGESYDPDNIEVFKKSLLQLAESEKINLKYINDLGTESNQGEFITADFKKAVWHFGFSRATMTTEIEYTLPNGEKILINGVSKVFGMGTKTYHLLGSFVNANSKLLQEIAK